MQTQAFGTISSVHLNGHRLHIQGNVRLSYASTDDKGKESTTETSGAFALDLEDTEDTRSQLHVGREIAITVDTGE